MQIFYNQLEDTRGRTSVNPKGLNLSSVHLMLFKWRGIPALSHCCNSFTCVTVFTTNNSAALENTECLQSARQYWSMDSNVNKMIFLSVTVICFHILHRFTNYHHHEWEINL